MRAALPIAVCASLAAGCGPSPGRRGNHAPDGAATPVASVSLPGGGGGIDFDDLQYDASGDVIVSAARGTGFVDLVDPATRAISSAPSDAASASGGGGWVFALRRSAGAIDVIDPATQQVVATASLLGDGRDYVRYVGSRNELWVTEPGSGRIEILALGSGATPAPVFAAFVETPGGPEGLTIDESRGRAWVHLFGGGLAGIDLAGRTVVETYETGCSHTHGFPAVDPVRGWVFATCSTPEIRVVDVEHGGNVTDSYSLPGSGEGLPAWSSATGHVYLRADPGETVAVLSVTSAGTLVHEGDFAATMSGHCLAADAGGSLWVCDAGGGALLEFTDLF